MKTSIVMTTVCLLLGIIAGCSISNAQSADPKIRVILNPAPENLDDVRAVLRRFADKEGLSIAETRLPPLEERPDYLMVKLSLNDSFMAIATNFARTNRVFIGIYEPKPNPGFEQMALRLEEVLREKWPYIAPYEGR
jgi:hypothetical protein